MAVYVYLVKDRAREESAAGWWGDKPAKLPVLLPHPISLGELIHLDSYRSDSDPNWVMDTLGQ